MYYLLTTAPKFHSQLYLTCPVPMPKDPNKGHKNNVLYTERMFKNYVRKQLKTYRLYRFSYSWECVAPQGVTELKGYVTKNYQMMCFDKYCRTSFCLMICEGNFASFQLNKQKISQYLVNLNFSAKLKLLWKKTTTPNSMVQKSFIFDI